MEEGEFKRVKGELNSTQIGIILKKERWGGVQTLNGSPVLVALQRRSSFRLCSN